MAKYKLPKIEDLFEAGVHFGHQIRRWHPKMEPYIYTHRKGVHIIDLGDTKEKLEEAAEHLYNIAADGGKIVFVGTKKQAQDIIELEAKRCGAMFVTQRWLGGTITNFSVIRKNIDKLLEFIRKREEGEFEHYTKKERLLIDREIEKLNDSVGGIVGLKGKPDALFVIDAKREDTAIREANIADIPVTAVIDTNSDPRNVDYPIPGNDDAIRSIALITKVIADAIESGYEKHAEKMAHTEESQAKEEKEKGAAKVSRSEAPHVAEKAGEEHVERVKKGEEPVEDEEIEEEDVEEVIEETEE